MEKLVLEKEYEIMVPLFGAAFYIDLDLYQQCFVLFDLILKAPSTIFQLNRDGSFWVEPLLS